VQVHVTTGASRPRGTVTLSILTTPAGSLDREDDKTQRKPGTNTQADLGQPARRAELLDLATTLHDPHEDEVDQDDRRRADQWREVAGARHIREITKPQAEQVDPKRREGEQA
jgi:hypothetical protein